ncbi:MAG: stalk domain-containing protein [Armatimonadota bacterium]
MSKGQFGRVTSRFVFSAVVIIALMVLVVSSASAQSEIWTKRVSEQGRLLVPIRGIFEAFGATVNWNAPAREVNIDYRGGGISMWVNDYTAYVSGNRHRLDVPARLIGGRVHVPLRFVGEALGGTVDYVTDYVDITVDGQLLRVHLSSGQSSGGSSGGSGYIASWTSSRPVYDSDLRGYSNWQLTLLRNEIYARHGRVFDNANIRRYFLNQRWYSPNPNFRESWLTSLESSNAAKIRDYQMRRFGSTATRP